MAKIQFRAKPSLYQGHLCVKVPNLTNAHCDMPAMRTHPRLGAFANSDLFPAMLARAVPFKQIRMDHPPSNVAIDATGFLALVTIEI